MHFFVCFANQPQLPSSPLSAFASDFGLEMADAEEDVLGAASAAAAARRSQVEVAHGARIVSDAADERAHGLHWGVGGHERARWRARRG